MPNSVAQFPADLASAIDPNSPLPLYYQIKEHLLKLIQTGALQPNDLLPAETQLAAGYGVNRLTVRQAISELVNEGLLVRRQGVGTFVAEPKLHPSHARLLSFSQRMAQLGRKASSEVLEAETLPAPFDVAQHLDLAEGTPVHKLVRLRLADGQPLMIETAYLPAAIAPDLLSQDLSGSLYRVLTEVYGIIPKEADQFIEPVLVREWEANILDVATGQPALMIDTTVHGADGRIIEFSRAIMRGKLARLYFHVSRSEGEP